MNKERCNQIIDEVYKNYLLKKGSEIGEYGVRPILLLQEEFINKCKSDNEFYEKWGLKIDERELSTQERKNVYDKLSYVKDIFPTDENGWSSLFDDCNIPTKQITLEYNNEKIEIYE